MYFISHRGNVSRIEKGNENKPEYIENALKLGFDVEVDVRFHNGDFYLGHDVNQYKINQNFLLNKKIWCHAKTPESIQALIKIQAHFFWHQEDDYTLTSKGFLWTYPGKKLLPESICVLPEMTNYQNINCRGICSDIIEKYRNDKINNI